MRSNLDNPADAVTERIRDSHRDTGDNLGHFFFGSVMAHSFHFEEKNFSAIHKPNPSLI